MWCMVDNNSLGEIYHIVQQHKQPDLKYDFFFKVQSVVKMTWMSFVDLIKQQMLLQKKPFQLELVSRQQFLYFYLNYFIIWFY